jgi:signal transduction histidine kinase
MPREIGGGQAGRRLQAQRLDSESANAGNPGGARTNGKLAQLLRQHRALVKKHAALLRRCSEVRKAESDLHGMAGLALRSSKNACALVRAGVLSATNPAFHRMDRQGRRQGTWQSVPVTSGRSREIQRSCRTLAELVVHEARRLRGEMRLREWRSRYVNGATVIEVALERATIAPRQVAVMAVVRDVTALAKLEAEVHISHQQLLKQEQVRAMGEVAIGVAHDVNNILSALMLRVAVLGQDRTCQAAQGHNIEALARILADGSALVRKLQAFARPGSCDVDDVDLTRIVGDAVEIATSGLQLRVPSVAAHVSIDVRLPETLPLVRATAQDLRHVFVNLLINARDAMPEGGRVCISAETSSQHVVVRVEDEGHGIPEQDLGRIFDSFFTTKGALGNGLGLAIAKSVLESIGGSISARNRPEGGACFELRFSRRRVAHAPRPSPYAVARPAAYAAP